MLCGGRSTWHGRVLRRLLESRRRGRPECRPGGGHVVRSGWGTAARSRRPQDRAAGLGRRRRLDRRRRRSARDERAGTRRARPAHGRYGGDRDRGGCCCPRFARVRHRRRRRRHGCRGFGLRGVRDRRRRCRLEHRERRLVDGFDRSRFRRGRALDRRGLRDDDRDRDGRRRRVLRHGGAALLRVRRLALHDARQGRGLRAADRVRPLRQEPERIHVALRVGRDADAEVDVCPGMLGVAARPEHADGLALLDEPAAPHGGLAEVKKRDRVPVGRPNRDRAPASGHRPGKADGSAGGRAHGRAVDPADVHAAMEPRPVRVAVEGECS